MKLIFFPFIRLGGIVIFVLFSRELNLEKKSKIWYMMVAPF